MSDVVVSVIESTTNVTVTEQDVAVAVTETSVDVSSSTAGIQGASYAKGDPIYEYVRNSTGATLLKGQIVYLSGATGNHVNVSLAQASGDSTSARTIGWVSEDILNNAQGYVMMFGYLEGIDTSGANAVGDILYLSPTVAGGWTSTKPYAPDHLVYVGVCVRKNPSNGAVSVHIQNGYELDEIHDVQITSVADGDLLRYESSTDLWKNKAASTLTLAQSQITNLVSDLAGKASLGAANAFTVGGHSITAEGTAIVPLVIKGAVNQSGNLQEWQNSGSTAIAKIDKNGAVSATYFGPSGVGLLGYLDWTASSPLFQTGGTAVVGIRVRGAVNQSANLQEWQSSAGATALSVNGAGLLTGTRAFAVNQSNAGEAMFVLRGAASQTGDQLAVRDSSANTIAGFSATGRLYSGVSGSGQTYLGSLNLGSVNTVATQLGVIAGAATTVGAVVRGAASASADLTQWQNSGGTVLARVGNTGDVYAPALRTTNDYVVAGQTANGGTIRIQKADSASAPPSNQIRIMVLAGTNVNTLKLVAIGPNGTPVTILDNLA